MIEELESKKVPYQLLADGAVIKVPSDQVTKLRVSLAQWKHKYIVDIM